MILVCAALLLPAIAFQSCASSAPANETELSFTEEANLTEETISTEEASFTEMEGKKWFLSEVRSAGKTIRLDRKKLEADGFVEIYDITFQEGRANGMGAPNRFFGPYTVGSNKGLSMGNMASTMMMAFKEPDDLKEYEFLSYLSRVTRWDFREGKLELHCSSNTGDNVVLVFVGP